MEYFPERFTGFNKAGSYRLLSLSGGGYRAALFHCGFLRALRAAGRLTPGGDDRHHCVISAVSGGTITAYLWEQFLDHEELAEFWPEKMLLSLVTDGPSQPITPLLLLRLTAGRHRRFWYSHLCSWWKKVVASAGNSPSRTLRHGLHTLYLMAETVDASSAMLLVTARGKLRLCNRSFMREGDNALGIATVDVPWAIYAATAVPGIYNPLKFEVKEEATTLALNHGQYVLVDAGVIDNRAILPFVYLLAEEFWPPKAEASEWITSDAGSPMVLPDEGKSYHNYTGRVGKLRLSDYIGRYAGDISQNLHFALLLKLFKNHKLIGKAWAVRVGLLPEDDAKIWWPSKGLTTRRAIAEYPTHINRMPKEQAVTLMAHGAQTASIALGLSASVSERLRLDIGALLQP